MASSGEIEKLERRWAENQLGLTFAPLAEAYRKAGDPAHALLLLQAGLAQHPHYIPAHIVRGRCHLDTQSDGEAELSFLRVTELDPENVIALKSLAEISERAGRLPEAMRRLETLLDVDRNNEEARGQLDRVREVHASMSAFPVSSIASEEVFPRVPVADAPAPEAALPEVPAIPVEYAEAVSDGAFEIPNDADTLLPSDDHIEDIELEEEVELEVREPAENPAAETSSFVLSVGDFSSPMVYEPPPPSPADEPDSPEPVEEDTPVVESSDDSYESFEPEPRHWYSLPVPVPEPPPAWGEPTDPIAEPAGGQQREPEYTDAPPPAGEPELVVTETMAEIFLRQGHRELALAVYTQLSLRDPGNERIVAAAAALQQELAPPAPPPPAEEPTPRFAAAETGGRSVHALLGALLSASRPTVATAIHPPAFEAPRRPGGEPTRPAQEALSLGAVFGDEASPSGPAAAPESAGGEPSFDEFFAPGASAETELPRAPGNESAAAASQVPEDLEEFNAWLRGLKR